jgi:hypothetical protein
VLGSVLIYDGSHMTTPKQMLLAVLLVTAYRRRPTCRARADDFRRAAKPLHHAAPVFQARADVVHRGPGQRIPPQRQGGEKRGRGRHQGEQDAQTRDGARILQGPPAAAPLDTTRGLVFLPASYVFKSETDWRHGMSLIHAGGHVRGAGADDVYHSRYFPHIDGVFASQQRDHDDMAHIKKRLACALTQCGSLNDD